MGRQHLLYRLGEIHHQDVHAGARQNLRHGSNQRAYVCAAIWTDKTQNPRMFNDSHMGDGLSRP